MRKYEVAVVLAPTLTEEEVDQSIETFQEIAKEKEAQVANVDNWGKRNLAYPINKHTEGIYVILTLEESNAESVAELERRFKMTESVIRFLTIRVDLNLKRAEKIKSRRDSKKRLNTLSEDNNETQTVSVAVED
ncbi:MAG: 30S ribosomal protein S6 [Acidobacteriota bacterium]|nr:30S ribosomal protein S6 [Acidobacteriota bacterium]